MHLESLDYQLKGGLSVGFAGLSVGGIDGGIYIAMDGQYSKTMSVYAGLECSLVNMPYVEVNGSYTYGNLKFRIKNLFRWKPGKKKYYKRNHLRFKVRRAKKYVQIKWGLIGGDFRLYPNKKGGLKWVDYCR